MCFLRGVFSATIFLTLCRVSGAAGGVQLHRGKVSEDFQLVS